MRKMGEISMKRLFVLLFSILLIGGILTGCNSTSDQVEQTKKAEQAENNSYPVTIEDASGEKITLDEKPERIISLIPSNTEISYALGLGDEIVGVSDYDDYPEEVSEKEKIGGIDFNVEKVISLAPQLVLANSSNAEEGLQQLRDAGLTVLVVNDATNFEQVYKSIEMIGKATGEQQKAENVIQDMKESLENIQEKAKVISKNDQKRVFIEIMPAPEIYTAGKNTFMHEILTIINAENAAKDHEGWVKMNEEAIIALNPDVIITTYGFNTEDPRETVLSRNAWQDIEAIKNKQVFDIHSNLIDRPGPRLVEGVEKLAKAVYPEIFAQ